MNWKSIIANILANLAAQGGAVAFVPAKYQPAVQTGLAFAGAMAALFQLPPHKDAGK